MKRNLVFFSIVFLLLLGSAVIFLSAYRQLNSYADLATRQNAVLHCFQDLSRQINDAAVMNPELIAVGAHNTAAFSFFADSAAIMKMADSLNRLVRDPVNIDIAHKLLPTLHQELSWILRSNVPDSIVHDAAYRHVNSFRLIDSLSSEGIKRTRFVIANSRQELGQETNAIAHWMIGFITVSGLLALYSSVRVLQEQRATAAKTKELGTVLNRISDSVISIDKEWRVTYCNDAALTRFGKTEPLGKKIYSIYPTLRESVFMDSYEEALASNTAQAIESALHPSGFWYSEKIYPSHDGLTIYSQDITRSKHSEKQLSDIQQEIRDYKFALDESSIVAVTDQRGRITHVNDNFCKISKYDRTELLGQDHRIINSGYHSKHFIKQLWITIAGGRIWKGELRNRAKDGTIYWVDTTIVPFLNEQGKPYQYIAIRSDITERKAAEERLIQSEKIYKTIASSIPGTVICLFDLQFRFILVEGEMIETIGFSNKGLVNQLAKDVLPGSMYVDLKKYLEKALAGETVTREINRAGLDIIARYIPLKDDKDNVYALMTVATDVTELKTAQRNISRLNEELEEKIIRRTDELRRSNQEMEAFSYSVSHDLRAPLRGIIGFASILEEDYAPKLDEEGLRVISIIKENTLKMGSLIDDLLAFSRLGKVPLSKAPVDMNMLVANVVADLQRDMHIIKWQIAPLPSVNADSNTIRQVWMNLLSNAVKYSRKQVYPQIAINASIYGNEVIFSVRDNGVGFNPAYTNKLFKVFQRLHDAGQFEGTGVGLAIVEKIITRHGGKVWAEGQEGVGACFYFSLPL